MTKRKLPTLVLDKIFGKPVNVGKLLRFIRNGERIHFGYVFRYTPRRKEPILAEHQLRVRVIKADFLNPNDEVKTIVLTVKTRGKIPKGLLHGQYDLTLDTATSACEVPDEIRSSGKKVSDHWNCSRCGTAGVPTENIDGYPANKCPEGHEHWWNTTCCNCQQIINSRAEMTKCEYCGYWHCPHCGVCSLDCFRY
jgi:hypothetical protein